MMRKLLLGVLLATSAMSANAAVTYTSTPVTNGMSFTGSIGTLGEFAKIDFSIAANGGNASTIIFTDFLSTNLAPIFGVYDLTNGGALALYAPIPAPPAIPSPVVGSFSALGSPFTFSLTPGHNYSVLYGADGGAFPLFNSNISSYGENFVGGGTNFAGSTASNAFDFRITGDVSTTLTFSTPVTPPSPTAVPEPESVLMMMSGLMLIGFRRFKKGAAKNA